MGRREWYVAGAIALAFSLAFWAGYISCNSKLEERPKTPIEAQLEGDQVQIWKITEGVDDRGNAVRVTEYALAKCKRCRELFEEPEG